MSFTIACAKCGFQAQHTSRFCPRCGNNIAAQMGLHSIIACEECGFQVQSTGKSCPRCGNNVASYMKGKLTQMITLLLVMLKGDGASDSYLKTLFDEITTDIANLMPADPTIEEVERATVAITYKYPTVFIKLTDLLKNK